jgi:hypothetical protein
MMDRKKIGCRTVDNQDGAVHQLGEHNFLWHELATKNQNGCSSPNYKNLNLIQNQVMCAKYCIFGPLNLLLLIF